MSDFDLPAILRLGELDRDLRRAQRRKQDATRLAAPQRGRVQEAESALAQLKEAEKQAQRDVARLEGEAKSKQAEVEKAQGNLNTAKSNDEYQLLLRSIEQRTAELGALETQILEAYEQQDAHGTERKRLEERLAQQKKELAEANKRVQAEEEAAQAVIETLQAEHDEVAKRVGQEHTELYQRILDTAGDQATAAVLEEMCQGCYIRIRPDQFSKVKGGKELVTCTQCGRILYMHPDEA